jgi:ubiquinone/menaquinone biosynthesis C-methylase UbiE
MKGQRISPDTNPASTEILKHCCAELYESDLAKLLLGDSFHPGGLRLTERLGSLLQLSPESRVLDVASGKGASAFFLAERFGCHVVGVDYGSQNVAKANELADTRGLASRVRFERGDAERLPFPNASFDVVLCECAFCTFPDKAVAAREFARVLRLNGQLGLSDLARAPVLPKELDSLLAWIACIADAQSVESYAECLRFADLEVGNVELHNEALAEMVQQIRMKLLGAEIMVGLNKLDLRGVDLSKAKDLANSAVVAIRQGQLSYVIITASKSH